MLNSQSMQNHYCTFHIMDYKGNSVNNKRLSLIQSRLKQEIQDDLEQEIQDELEIKSLESSDDNEAEEISVLKDKEDELLLKSFWMTPTVTVQRKTRTILTKKRIQITMEVKMEVSLMEKMTCPTKSRTNTLMIYLSIIMKT
jgi:hypothetical protein